MARINADPRVMEFFSSSQTIDQIAFFVLRYQNLFRKKGFCYFIVDLLATNHFIGSVGLSEATFEASVIP